MIWYYRNKSSTLPIASAGLLVTGRLGNALRYYFSIRKLLWSVPLLGHCPEHNDH